MQSSCNTPIRLYLICKRSTLGRCIYKSDTNLMDVLQLLLIMKNLAEQIHFSAEFES